MANKSGVLVENITNIAGVVATSITSLAGVLTTSLPGWPSGGASCTLVSLSHGEFPGAACLGIANVYDFDSTNQILYQAGYCGNPLYYAAFGFYKNEDNELYQYQEAPSGPVWTYFATC